MGFLQDLIDLEGWTFLGHVHKPSAHAPHRCMCGKYLGFKEPIANA